MGGGEGLVVEGCMLIRDNAWGQCCHMGTHSRWLPPKSQGIVILGAMVIVLHNLLLGGRALDSSVTGATEHSKGHKEACWLASTLLRCHWSIKTTCRAPQPIGVAAVI